MRVIICDFCGKAIDTNDNWIRFETHHEGSWVTGMDMMPKEFHAHHACWFNIWPGQTTKLPSLTKPIY